MENKNLYEILGIKSDSTKEEIKIAYRKLVRIYHPDVNKTKEAEVFFKMLNNAAEILLDDVKRLQYDTLAGLSGPKKQSVKKNTEAENNFTRNKDVFKGANSAETKKEQAFGAYSTGKNVSKGGFSYNNTPKNDDISAFYAEQNPKTNHSGAKLDGKDIEVSVKISKSESLRGTLRKINVLHTEKCPKCLGRKYINGTVCAICRGAGEKSEHKIMNVKIPAGIKTGMKMKIKNEGEYGKFGGKNGDLYLLIQIEEQIIKKTEGNTIIYEVPISPPLAVLGGTVTVNADDFSTKIKIPPLTKSKTRFKLNKEGQKPRLSSLNEEYQIEVIIDIDKNLSKDEVELYKKLQNIGKKQSN